MALPYRVGLTGGIGSGKSLVSAEFVKLGVPVIDADEIVHELIAPGKPAASKIIRTFGNTVNDGKGGIDRGKLRELVFSEPGYRLELEAILHPEVYESVRRRVETLTSPYCILSIPLLLESGGVRHVDTVLVVDCPVSLQIDRVSRRDGIPTDMIRKIIESQASREERLSAADEIIVNDSDPERVADKVKALHSEYTRRGSKRSGKRH